MNALFASRTIRTWNFSWIVLWLACSIIPFIPFTFSLFNEALTDTPSAYLAWIPVLAFARAARSLWFMRLNRDSYNGYRRWPAYFVCAGLSATLTFAVDRQSAWLFRNDFGLLFWAIWATGLMYMLAGPRGVRVSWQPLLYLLTVWPPIYIHLVNILNPILSTLAIHCISRMGDMVHWIRLVNGTVFSVVNAHGGVTPVVISSACSGSDSILALIVLFPFTFVLIRGGLVRKITFTLLGCVMTLAMNLVRIVFIIMGLHWVGYGFAFKVLHPLLGPVLFLVVVLALAAMGAQRAGVERPRDQMHQEGRFSQPKGSRLVAGTIALLLAVGTIPLYRWSVGTEFRPLFFSLQNSHLVVQSIQGFRCRDAMMVGNQVTAVYSGGRGSEIRVVVRFGNQVSAKGFWTTLRNFNRIHPASVHPTTIHLAPGVRGHQWEGSSFSNAVPYVVTEYSLIARRDTKYTRVFILTEGRLSDSYRKFQELFFRHLLTLNQPIIN